MLVDSTTWKMQTVWRETPQSVGLFRKHRLPTAAYSHRDSQCCQLQILFVVLNSQIIFLSPDCIPVSEHCEYLGLWQTKEFEQTEQKTVFLTFHGHHGVPLIKYFGGTG